MKRDAVTDDLRERDSAFDQVVDRRVRRVLAEVLRSIRKETELSQVQLSELTGVPQTTISKIERAHRDVTLLEFLAICKALSVSPTETVTRLFEEIDQQKLQRPGQR
ncbi:MAG: helix-turn-helix domain-containing protein [Thermomicrobiales bacterium]|nr:helix-turn-helix domain-containing protein [Thermomicrobiales bacterium]MCO5219136.1 helix-turn-helix domain-containing protein [Thermomicrobiales bacterium]MCO5225436.1 helix-turn-helix domain-containing protein [Thermomicrobiales bacterium]MCO5228990.1 helix-turn-helix domain-containing protein [Thermomicrobiales bacterium]